MTTCYRESVTNDQQTERPAHLTEERVHELVHAAQLRVLRGEAEVKAAIKARNDLFRDLHAQGVMATEMSRATPTEDNPKGLHRTVIQRIATPGE